VCTTVGERCYLLYSRELGHFTEGVHFSSNSSDDPLIQWRTRLSLTLKREMANAIFESARKARGGRTVTFYGPLG
jgi:hypothetical protein